MDGIISHRTHHGATFHQKGNCILSENQASLYFYALIKHIAMIANIRCRISFVSRWLNLYTNGMREFETISMHWKQTALLLLQKIYFISVFDFNVTANVAPNSAGNGRFVAKHQLISTRVISFFHRYKLFAVMLTQLKIGNVSDKCNILEQTVELPGKQKWTRRSE